MTAVILGGPARPGQILPIAVPLIAAMMVVVAILVDVGRLYFAQPRLQQAVDAAAAYGAMWVDEDALRVNPSCVRLAPTVAAAKAIEFFANERAVSPELQGATIAPSANPISIVVTGQQTINLTFLAAFQAVPNSPLPRVISATARARPDYTNRAVTCPTG